MSSHASVHMSQRTPVHVPMHRSVGCVTCTEAFPSPPRQARRQTRRLWITTIWIARIARRQSPTARNGPHTLGRGVEGPRWGGGGFVQSTRCVFYLFIGTHCRAGACWMHRCSSWAAYNRIKACIRPPKILCRVVYSNSRGQKNSPKVGS